MSFIGPDLFDSNHLPSSEPILVKSIKMLSFSLFPTFQIKVSQQISLPKFCKRCPNYYIKKTISVLEDRGMKLDSHRYDSLLSHTINDMASCLVASVSPGGSGNSASRNSFQDRGFSELSELLV
jgi:hypothetical protein